MSDHTAYPLTVVDLRVDFLPTPLDLENRHPLLSWRMESPRRGARQTAYQIEVATSPALLTTGHPDLWNTGRIDSDQSIGIPYNGQPLVSRQNCYWRVKIWDAEGTLATSAPTTWEMGLLDSADWSAEWLAVEWPVMRKDREGGSLWIRGPTTPGNKSAKFGLNVSLPARARGTVVLGALGPVALWCDGRPIDIPTRPMPFGPPVIPEITVSLDAGHHALAVCSSAPTLPVKILGVPNNEVAPLLRIEHPDGTVCRWSGAEWKTAVTDAEGWASLDFDDTSWEPATPVLEPRPAPWPKQPAMLMRRRFCIKQPIARARLYTSALGAYEVFLNGRRVGDAVLAPESSDFRRRARYQTYDVTAHVIVGDNVLGALVGDGWYASYQMVVGRYPWGDAPRQWIAQLELTYADGSRENISTGSEWRVFHSPVMASEIYDGEHYDARLEQPGWSTAEFDDSIWWRSQAIPDPKPKLTSQSCPPIRRTKTLAARSVRELTSNRYVFDFGQNFAGWVRLHVKGAAGTIVELRFAESVTETGEIDPRSLRSAEAKDIYVLRGDPDGETFEPHFTYHGFRYVQLSGFPGRPDLGTLEGIVLHSDLPITATFAIDAPTIQRLWHNAQWSQRANFMGIPTDCPQRDERLGWLGDANVFWGTAAFNMDVCAFTRRFMEDVRDAQAKSGAFPDFAPKAFEILLGSDGKGAVAPQWASREGSADSGATPGWADAGVTLPWTVWQRYGDTEIIEANWDAMVRYLKYVADRNPDGIWQKGRGSDYGDWMALDSTGFNDPSTPKDLVATALWAHSVACMAQMADAMARPAEAALYRAAWTRIANAFRKAYVAADGTVGNASQTSYILALHFNLVPDALKSIAAAKLAHDITQRGTVLSTGFIGTPYSLDVLADHGYTELVYDLLLRTEFPSWGYMVAQGATTIWESWQADREEQSLNHYALGAVCDFLMRRIAGIAPKAPGFRQIEIRPLLDSRVRRGAGRYESVLGTIATEWEQAEMGDLRLTVTVPPNATAHVHLPAEVPRWTESGSDLVGGDHLNIVGHTATETVVQVGSGCYRFLASA
jgi:alpha-L-rhamnosidase